MDPLKDPETQAPAAIPETPERIREREEPTPDAPVAGTDGDEDVPPSTAIPESEPDAVPEAPPERAGPADGNAGADPGTRDRAEAILELPPAEGTERAAPEIEDIPEEAPELTKTQRRRGIKALLGAGATKVASKLYDSRADDLEQRARRAVASAYQDQADDLEERATRAMRQAIRSEADRIKEAIEHGVQVKKREVRLSLAVLVVASVVYLLLYWMTRGGGGAAG